MIDVPKLDQAYIDALEGAGQAADDVDAAHIGGQHSTRGAIAPTDSVTGLAQRAEEAKQGADDAAAIADTYRQAAGESADLARAEATRLGGIVSDEPVDAHADGAPIMRSATEEVAARMRSDRTIVASKGFAGDVEGWDVSADRFSVPGAPDAHARLRVAARPVPAARDGAGHQDLDTREQRIGHIAPDGTVHARGFATRGDAVVRDRAGQVVARLGQVAERARERDRRVWAAGAGDRRVHRKTVFAKGEEGGQFASWNSRIALHAELWNSAEHALLTATCTKPGHQDDGYMRVTAKCVLLGSDGVPAVVEALFVVASDPARRYGDPCLMRDPDDPDLCHLWLLSIDSDNDVLTGQQLLHWTWRLSTRALSAPSVAIDAWETWTGGAFSKARLGVIRPIVLRRGPHAGRWVMGLHGSRIDPVYADQNACALIYSDDASGTWTLGAVITHPFHSPSELAIEELTSAPGRIGVLMRNQRALGVSGTDVQPGQRVVGLRKLRTASDDGAATAGLVHEVELPDTAGFGFGGCLPSVARLSGLAAHGGDGEHAPTCLAYAGPLPGVGERQDVSLWLCHDEHMGHWHYDRLLAPGLSGYAPIIGSALIPRLAWVLAEVSPGGAPIPAYPGAAFERLDLLTIRL